MSPRSLALAAAVASLPVALTVTAPAGAGTVSFGSTLDLVTPNSDPAKTCSGGAWWYAEQGVFLNPIAAGDRGSCQFTASGFYNGQPFGLFVPASGTVTAARIKIGSITGPMRINVVRTLFQQTGDVAYPSTSTPFLQQYGPTFTPQANAITTVPLNLKVRSQATPDPSDTSTVAGTDWLAVEVLAPDVPVPLVAYPNGTFFAAFPGPTAGNVPAPSPNPLPNYGQLGYVLAVSADLETGSGGGGTTTPTTPTTPATGGGGAAAALGSTTAKVAKGAARVSVTCQTSDCSGTVTIVSSGGVASAQATKRATTYGSASFSIKAGARSTVKVSLNTKGKRALAGKSKLKARAVLALKGAATKTTLALTLKR